MQASDLLIHSGRGLPLLAVCQVTIPKEVMVGGKAACARYHVRCCLSEANFAVRSNLSGACLPGMLPCCHLKRRPPQMCVMGHSSHALLRCNPGGSERKRRLWNADLCFLLDWP